MNKDASLISNSTSGSEKFEARYLQVVASEMQKLREQMPSKRDIIFAANSNPVFDPVNANLIKDEIFNLSRTGTTIIFSTQLPKY